MSAAGALAITGTIFLLAAIALGIAADDARYHRRTAQARGRLGWAMFGIAAACGIAAAWTEALT